MADNGREAVPDAFKDTGGTNSFTEEDTRLGLQAIEIRCVVPHDDGMSRGEQHITIM
jgi:hypothetical protein